MGNELSLHSGIICVMPPASTIDGCKFMIFQAGFWLISHPKALW